MKGLKDVHLKIISWVKPVYFSLVEYEKEQEKVQNLYFDFIILLPGIMRLLQIHAPTGENFINSLIPSPPLANIYPFLKFALVFMELRAHKTTKILVLIEFYITQFELLLKRLF